MKNIESMPAGAIVYDIVYNPLQTALISKAKKYGKNHICGLDMLIYQAEKAINIWSGKNPDVQSMKIAALRTL